MRIEIINGRRVGQESIPDGLYTLKLVEKIRSVDQNARYWAILGYIATESGNSTDSLHELMKKKFLSRRKLVKLGKKRQYIYLTKSTTKLTTKQFAEYNEQVEEFFRDFGIVVPDPNSGWWDSLEE